MIKFEQNTTIRQILLEKYHHLRNSDKINPRILQSTVLAYQIININNICQLHLQLSKAINPLV